LIKGFGSSQAKYLGQAGASAKTALDLGEIAQMRQFKTRNLWQWLPNESD
jgi:hypothetical protein